MRECFVNFDTLWHGHFLAINERRSPCLVRLRAAVATSIATMIVVAVGVRKLVVLYRILGLALGLSIEIHAGGA
jgi:hypothetical protein